MIFILEDSEYETRFVVEGQNDDLEKLEERWLEEVMVKAGHDYKSLLRTMVTKIGSKTNSREELGKALGAKVSLQAFVDWLVALPQAYEVKEFQKYTATYAEEPSR